MNIEKVMEGFKAMVVVALLGIVAFACNGDEPSSNNEYVNDWILEEMEIYYLWNDDIPNSPNMHQDPDKFFESLLSDEDRFSWIQEDYEELLKSLQGINKEAGYEFKLYRESGGSENVIAQVTYIKEGSPADSKDLVRGDVITHINGERMTLSNYQSVLGQISNDHTIQYKRNNGSGVFVDKGTLSLSTVEFAENPNFMHTVLDYPASGKKIGYYVYNFFAPGEDDQYNEEMENIFSSFQSEGITDLVVDLRYNSGGAVTATIRLASLIGNGVDNTKVFVRREYNNDLQQEIIDDPRYGPDFLEEKFENKTQNIGAQISGRLYVLTSSRTASASELLINGLKPYMSEIVIIGDTTVGKNVGSMSIYEPNDKKNSWGMQPIIVKSYNSEGSSDYATGFYPDIVDLDNDLVIFPLGDPQEILLSLAIGEITGAGGRRAQAEKKQPLNAIGSSVDLKRGKFNLWMDDDRIKEFLKSKELVP